jgi:fucose permease
MNRFRVLSCCLIYFGNGLNDSAPGALIPYIETHYRIGYAVVSLIFVAQALGFIVAAFFIDALHSRFGRAKSLILAEALMIAGYVMTIPAPPYPVVVVAYFWIGLAEAINLALNNVFCANLTQSTVILGATHGSYGIGGILGPIVTTAMVSTGILWSYFYLIGLGIRFCCLAFAGWAFWGYEKEAAAQFMSALERTASRRTALETGDASKRQLLARALKDRTTLLGGLFIFAYQGAEVSISGWVISYLIEYRHGDPTHVGYVTAGFWVCSSNCFSYALLTEHLGWYHTWPLRSLAPRPSRRRAPPNFHPHLRRHRLPDSRLAGSLVGR